MLLWTVQHKCSAPGPWLSSNLFTRLGGLAKGGIHAKREYCVDGTLLQYNIIKMRRMDILSRTHAQSVSSVRREITHYGDITKQVPHGGVDLT